MTTRNRSFRRTSRRPRRTSCLVWVNKVVDGVSLTENGIDIVPLLTSAADFMLFDTTIVDIRIPYLVMTLTLGGATAGLRGCGAALMVGNENLDAADILDGPRSSNIGPPWMWQGGTISRLGASASEFSIAIVTPGRPQEVKAQRRFKENNQELFLITENLVVGADDSNVQISGYFRILLRIP